MALAIITLVLLGITLISFLIGTVWLSKYAFRLGTGPGIGVLLFPPYTFYFAFYKLDVDAKDRPTALWMFGLVASILLVLIFSGPLSAAASGNFEALAAPKEEPQKKVVIDTTPDPATPKTETPPATTPPPATPTPDAGSAPAAGTPDAGSAAPATGTPPAEGTAPAAGTPPSGTTPPANGTTAPPAAGTP